MHDQQATKTNSASSTSTKPTSRQPESETSIERVKALLSEPKHRIELDDFATAQTRKLVKELGTDNFPVQSMSATKEEFAERLRKYNELIEPFAQITALLGKWANSKEQRDTLVKVFMRLPEACTEQAGATVWLGFRWYPILSLMYTAGIAALSASNYENIRTVLMTKVPTNRGDGKPRDLASAAIDEIYNIQSDNLFKSLPEHQRHYVPRSEYMLASLRPVLEETLYLGSSYEQLFDRFEVLLALTISDINTEGGWAWGPIGRFGWKYRSRTERDNPFAELVAEAKQYRKDWPPLKTGMFQGSLERFNEIASQYETGILNKLTWF